MVLLISVYEREEWIPIHFYIYIVVERFRLITSSPLHESARAKKSDKHKYL